MTPLQHWHGAPYTDHTRHVLPPGGYSMVHSPHRRLSDVLKRKKPPKRTSGRKSSRGEESGLEFFSAKGASGSTRSAPTTRGKLLAGQYTTSNHVQKYPKNVIHSYYLLLLQFCLWRKGFAQLVTFHCNVVSFVWAGKEGRSGGTSAKSSFLASLNPSRWGRSSNAAPDRPPPPKDPISLHKPNPSLPNHKEKVRSWIKQQGIVKCKATN